MLDSQFFIQALKKNNVNFFCGVPDSLLKHPCAYMTDTLPSTEHIIAANEGSAVAMASGYHFSEGGLSLVYLQNSGLGNTINPLLSLADPMVYSVPMVLLVGWRGQPGVPDEPQHQKQGAVCERTLKALDIPYRILSLAEEAATQEVQDMCSLAAELSRPTCLLVPKNTFAFYKKKDSALHNDSKMSRESAIEKIVESLPPRSIVVSTTGKTSRELFEIRKKRNESHEQDFLTVGSMGHASAIALMIALRKPQRKVFCIDGDGALLMHAGNLGLVGQFQPKNFHHILLNNEAHESVGGQPTCAPYINFKRVAEGFGYKVRDQASRSLQELVKVISEQEGPNFLEVPIRVGSRSDLGRPTNSPKENKSLFMEYLASD